MLIKTIQAFFKRLACDHNADHMVTLRDDGSMHISFCPKCETIFRVKKRK